MVGHTGYGQKPPRLMPRLSHGHNPAQALSGCRPAQRTIGLVRGPREHIWQITHSQGGGWEFPLNLMGIESGGRMSTATGDTSRFYCLASIYRGPDRVV